MTRGRGGQRTPQNDDVIYEHPLTHLLLLVILDSLALLLIEFVGMPSFHLYMKAIVSAAVLENAKVKVESSKLGPDCFTLCQFSHFFRVP